MPNIMSKMFDYNLEVGDVEKDLLSVKEKMEPIFYFIDLSFQLLLLSYKGKELNWDSTMMESLHSMFIIVKLL